VAQRILIVDDDQEMVTLGKMILEREGYEILSAHSGSDGLTVLQEQQVDLILLDIMMLGMNGWQVLETIKTDQKNANIPVIMLTARHYLEDESRISQYASMFDGYVVKPFVVRDLLGKIQKLLN
jgi:CheY-like chemotaxis protein